MVLVLWPHPPAAAVLSGSERFCLQAIYVYQKAAILSMMSEEEQKKTGEDVVELFR